MKVRELAEMLKGLNPEAEINVSSDEEGNEIQAIASVEGGNSHEYIIYPK